MRALLARLAAFVATTVFAAGAAAAPSSPESAAAENGRIAFAYLDGLTLANPNGSAVWPARPGPVSDVGGWSPDGTKLAVDAGGDIFIVSPDGGGRTRLVSSPGHDGHAVFSPDGTKVAFESDRDGTKRIWVMNVDGTGAYPLTPRLSYAWSPTWSPDGREIAFATNIEIWIARADGGGSPRRLVPGPAGGPAWSPDGTTIAFSVQLGKNVEVYSVRTDGSGLVRLTVHSAVDGEPQWSPDGTRIAFASWRNGTREIFTMARDGSDVRQVTSSLTGIKGRFAWQPLGTRPARCTIWGTPADDLLAGSTGEDNICGLDGNDRILGRDGDDVVDAGAGNDTVVAGPGRDDVDAGEGNDIVDARDRELDTVVGGGGSDSVLLDRGLDRVRSGEQQRDPDPENLARGRPVRASQALPSAPAERTVDGHRRLWWSALHPPQWIEIDLGAAYAVRSIALLAAQAQAGETEHTVLGRASPTAGWRRLAELRDVTRDRQTLTYTPRHPWRNVRYLRITTLRSPSVVAWKEIAVFRAR